MQDIGAYSVRLPAVMITGIDDLVKNHLLPQIETDAFSDFARQSTDEFRLAIKLTRSTPVWLPPEADRRQSMGQLLATSQQATVRYTLWFSGRSPMSRSNTTTPSATPQAKGPFELDALEAEWDALDADLGIDREVEDLPDPQMLGIPSLSTSRKRSNSDLSHLLPRTRQQRRALADGL
ncbi:hypothetical protein V8E54_012743 [Elaphomyces granulatus]